MAYVKCLMNVVSSTLPDGKTVTPTDDVSILLACAGRTETYTTISALLADATALAGVINSNNAIDYLVRSTTFASDVCADQGAMADIGANNYASNTLLANSTWLTAICGSSYFESVLNVKVPVMTSNTTPSGEVIASDTVSGYPAWQAFDSNTTTAGRIAHGIGKYIGYKFTTPVICVRTDIRFHSGNIDKYLIKGSTNGTNWTTLSSEITGGTLQTIIFENSNAYSYFCVMQSANVTTNQYDIFYEIQFYGRVDV